jgi:hypothetical protein
VSNANPNIKQTQIVRGSVASLAQQRFCTWRKATCSFSLLAQRKRTKRKGPRRLARCAGSLRFSAPAGVLRRDILVPRRTRRIPAAPLRADPAVSCDARRRQRDLKPHDQFPLYYMYCQVGDAHPTNPNGNRILHQNPFCCAEHRSPLRLRPVRGRQGCRPSFVGPGMARRKTPAKGEERRVPRRGATAGWPFLWFVSFGHTKEMNT